MLGLNQSFEWRRWDFNLFFRGIFGHQLAHENRIFYENIDPYLNVDDLNKTTETNESTLEAKEHDIISILTNQV
jgi:hypothetical protein